MVQAGGGGKRRLDILGFQCDLLHISRTRHGDRHEHLVKQVTAAREQESDVLRQKGAGESVTQADHHQQRSFCHQDGPFAKAVDGPAQQWLDDNAQDAAQGDEGGQGLGGFVVNRDNYPGGEGDEDLLARTVEHRQRVEQSVFLLQLEEGFRPGGLFLLHQEHHHRSHDKHYGSDDEAVFIGEVEKLEPQVNQEAPGDGCQVTHCVQLSQALAGLARGRQLHAHRAGHRHEQVCPETIQEQKHHHAVKTFGGETDQKNAGGCDELGDPAQAARAQKHEGSGNKQGDQAGQLTREFQE